MDTFLAVYQLVLYGVGFTVGLGIVALIAVGAIVSTTEFVYQKAKPSKPYRLRR